MSLSPLCLAGIARYLPMRGVIDKGFLRFRGVCVYRRGGRIEPAGSGADAGTVLASAGRPRPSTDRSSRNTASAVITSATKVGRPGAQPTSIPRTSPRTPTSWEKVLRKLRTGAMPPQGVAPARSGRPTTGLISVAGDRARSRAPPRTRIRAARCSIGSTAPSTPTRSAICSRSKSSTSTSLLPPTIRATASTTSPTCSACRRCCSSATLAPRRRSARWRSAIREIGAGRRHALSRAAGSVAGSAHRRAAARHRRRHCWCATRFRSTASTPSRSSCFEPTTDVVRGLEYPHQLEITVDGERVHLAHGRRRRRISRRSYENADAGVGRDRRAAAGPRPGEGRPAHGRRRRSSRSRRRRTPSGCSRSCAAPIDATITPGVPHIETLTITGPFNATGAGRHAEPPAHLRLPSRRERAADEDACATQIICDAGAPRLSPAGRRRRRSTV